MQKTTRVLLFRPDAPGTTGAFFTCPHGRVQNLTHHPFPHPNWHSSPKLDPEIHMFSSQLRIPSLTKHGHKFPAFPSIEASACLRTSLPVPGFGGRSRCNFGGNLPPIWAMKMSSTPNSPISCESRTGPGVAYVQTNPLLPEKKHKEHQIWETFWSQKNRKDGWI